MNLIVAVDDSWGIGKNNDLLIRIPEDLKFFKHMTKNKVVVMGRRTFDSLPFKEGLPDRINIVISTQKNYSPKGCIVVHSDDELFKVLSGFASNDIFFIGGASIYNKYYNICDTIYVTKIFSKLDADVFIVNFDALSNYSLSEASDIFTYQDITYQFCTYKKI